MQTSKTHPRVAPSSTYLILVTAIGVVCSNHSVWAQVSPVQQAIPASTFVVPAKAPGTSSQSLRSTRAIPAPTRPVAVRKGQSQDFLEDLSPPKSSNSPAVKEPATPIADPYQDALLVPIVPQKPTSPKELPASSPETLVPQSPQPDGNDELLEAAPSPNDDSDLLGPTQPDTSSMDELIEQREKASQPYPKPDLSGPSEKVVPLPIQKAPEDFKGFEPASPGDWNLPEPRRVYALPKVDVPTPPTFNQTWGNPQTDMQGATMPWHQSPNSNSNQFGSLLGGTPARYSPACVDVGYVTMPQTMAVPCAPYCAPQTCQTTAQSCQAPCQPHSINERLKDKYWKFQYARELPYRQGGDPVMECQSRLVPYEGSDFAPMPFQGKPRDPQLEIDTYFAKKCVDVQRPWVEWWRPLYTPGTYEPGVPVFSDVNLLTPSFLVYGDYRTGVGVHRNNGQHVRSWAHRLNLDMDMRFTSTERFHLFTGPLDHNNRFTRLDFSDSPATFEEELDAQVDTAFFEGDLGAMTGGWIGDDAPFDLPFTCGLVPLLYQNGIWMEDAIAGFALGSPWRHSRPLNWANYEATFFAGFNQVTSPAFQNDNNAAAVYGTAWFVEAYNGYIEMDYAYLDDLDGLGRSYHNSAIAYTRRYFGRISNSIRLIGNIGQSGPANTRTADGGLLLIENSLITSHPSTVVPYFNCFVGSGRPQSVARAGGAGGILKNTGINFETDGLTQYPTLNATASNSYGGAVGLNVLSADFRSQWVTEFAALDTYGDPVLSAAAGPEYAIGTRYQRSLSNRFIWRVDLMNGWFDNAPDIYGTRTEFRWKF